MRALVLAALLATACTPAQLAAVQAAAPLVIKPTCHVARAVARTCDVINPLPVTSGGEVTP